MPEFPLKQLFDSLPEDNYKLIIEGWISPYENENTIFYNTVNTFICPKFGEYCKFELIVNKQFKKYKKILIRIIDKNKKFYKKPKYIDYIDCDEDCLCINWTDTSYNGNRTYFHFEDSCANKSGEGDFAHYKCKYINSSIARI